MPIPAKNDRDGSGSNEGLTQPTPPIVQQCHNDEDEMGKFDRRLAWWSTLTPHNLLASRHPVKTYIPDGAIALDNDMITEDWKLDLWLLRWPSIWAGNTKLLGNSMQTV